MLINGCHLAVWEFNLVVREMKFKSFVRVHLRASWFDRHTRATHQAALFNHMTSIQESTSLCKNRNVRTVRSAIAA
jgi:hypothetical protein